MNLPSIAPFNVNPSGRATGKPFFLTAMIMLGAAVLAVALFVAMPELRTAQAEHDLDPPGQVVPVTETDTSILVEWTAPSDEALVTYYLVQWRLNSAQNFDPSDQVIRSKTEVLTQDITGLTAGTIYIIEVYSCADSACAHRSTDFTSVGHETLPEGFMGLSEPTNFSVSTTSASAELTWRRPSNAPAGTTIVYEYSHKLSAATRWKLGGAAHTIDAASRSATVSGLKTGMAYDFRVRACLGSFLIGCSAYATVLHRAALSPQANYDTDGNGLIEINHLVQLNAMRWDLDGNGAPDTEADQYNGAFPVTSDGSVCSTRKPCTGYELMADLDFDTNGDGSTDQAGDDYWNEGAGWKTIPNFYATFDGRGHTISNLFINATGPGHVGLFGTLRPDKTIRRLGLVDANVTSSQSTGGIVGRNLGKIETSYVTGEVRGGRWVGGLVGLNRSTVNASYSTASVTGRDPDSVVGGIVGSNLGTIRACYATGNVDGVFVGGLVGSHGGGGTITASYATGTVHATTSTVGGLVSIGGGLIGIASSDANTENYWDTNTSGVDRSAGGTGRTTADLQRPTGYSGIYSTWNAGGTDYWDFGSSRQYPALKVDFNADGDPTWEEFGFQFRDDLIAIANLEQLDAIRWDRNGDGVPDTGTSPANQAAYATAFPSLDPASHCVGGHGCKGYELVTNLDFDDARSYAGGKVKNEWSDPGESGAGWEPIPEYFAEFQGNGKTISNLYINSSGRGAVGLFGSLGAFHHPRNQYAKITRLRLADVNVTSSGDADIQDPGTGGLVGKNFGEIKYSSVTGRVTRKGSSSSVNNDDVAAFGRLTIVGGLVGENQGPIEASYAAVAVRGYNSDVGGLVGQNNYSGGGTITSSYATGKVRGDGDAGDVGGLVGSGVSGSIFSSYASGDVVGLGDGTVVGGLIGRSGGSAVHITANYSTSVVSGYGGGLVGTAPRVTSVLGSYWDNETSGIPSPGSPETVKGEGKTTDELQMPTNETVDNGIYATWDKDIWDFGTDSQYPALKADFDGDGTATWQEFGCQVRERPDLTVELKEGGAVAQLSWTTVSAGHCTPSPTIKYTLYRREGDTSQFKRVPEVPPTATDHTDRTLDPEYRYSYQVRVLVNEFPARASNIVKVKSRYVMDSDGDGFIEVANLAQLNSIRYDSDGDGVPSPGGATDYRAAFKVMGNIFCSGPCRGYELKADLDFDTGTPDDRTDDAYYRSGAGWKPMDYDAVFQGNGHSVSNLYIRSLTDTPRVGLFGRLGNGGLISHLSLVDVDVAASGESSAGGLVGQNDGGTIAASDVSGEVSATGVVSAAGGLVGRNDGGTIAGSDVSGEIAATGAESVAGGLVGRNDAGRITGSYASGLVSGAGAAGGGLVGLNAGGIIAGSYAASTVLGSADARGGLVGENSGGTILAAYATGSVDHGGGGLVGDNAAGTIIAAYSTGHADGGLVGTNSASVTHGISSYWDTSTSRAFSSAGGRAKTTAELQGPNGYTGIYANWNVDIDNADGDGDPFTGGDDPWNFGGPEDYPTLNLAALGVLSLGDRAALAEFYHATAGENWTRNDNWLSDKPMETWWGVKVNVAGRVTRVIMPGNNLVVDEKEQLPASLGNLAALEQLVLGGNSLSGPLPPELGTLANLRLLDLKNNSEASNLREGPSSGLEGPIPAELGNLGNLAQLYLNGNKLSGAVPSELGNLGSLVNLGLQNNPLSGPLPSSFTNLTRLRSLNFRNTSLCAPSSLQQWTSGLESFTGVHCK